MLDAAIKVFCERGYPAATVREVADEVGMLKGSLYHYIGSKEDLLRFILDDAHQMVTGIMVEVKRLDLTPLERIYVYVEKLLLWYLEHVEHARVTFHEWMHLTGENLALQQERRDGYEVYVKDLIRDCKRSGDVDEKLDLRFATFYLLGAINAVPQWYRRGGRSNPRQIARSYAEMTVGMLMGSPAKVQVR